MRYAKAAMVSLCALMTAAPSPYSPRQETVLAPAYAQAPPDECELPSGGEGLLPKYSTIRANQHGSAFAVLKRTSLTATLLEMLHINSEENVVHYSSDENLQELMDKVACGVSLYRQHQEPTLKHIVVDDGHGVYENVRNAETGLTEGDFTHRAQDFLARSLEDLGFVVHRLNHPGPERSRAERGPRLDAYVAAANAVHQQALRENATAMYIALHAESNVNAFGTDPTPLTSWVSIASPAAKDAAYFIVGQTSPEFCEHFTDHCVVRTALR